MPTIVHPYVRLCMWIGAHMLTRHATNNTKTTTKIHSQDSVRHLFSDKDKQPSLEVRGCYINIVCLKFLHVCLPYPDALITLFSHKYRRICLSPQRNSARI